MKKLKLTYGSYITKTAGIAMIPALMFYLDIISVLKINAFALEANRLDESAHLEVFRVAVICVQRVPTLEL